MTNLAKLSAEQLPPDLDQANQWTQKAAELAPDNPEVFDVQGDILEKRQQSNEAIAAYEKALQLAPLRIGTRERLIRLLELSGQTDKAEEQIRVVDAVRQQLKKASEASSPKPTAPVESESEMSTLEEVKP